MLLIKFFFKKSMSSYIQLPYGFRKNSEPIQFNLPKNYAESQYLNRLPYLSNKNDPNVENKILNAVKNRKDLQKWLLATSDVGKLTEEQATNNILKKFL